VEEGLVNIAERRPIGFALLLVLLAGAGCNRPKRAHSEPSTPATPQTGRASITMLAPDAFYDPPTDLPRKPGTLLRSELLKDLILPAGVRGWRILYVTTVDDASDGGARLTKTTSQTRNNRMRNSTLSAPLDAGCFSGRRTAISAQLNPINEERSFGRNHRLAANGGNTLFQ